MKDTIRITASPWWSEMFQRRLFLFGLVIVAVLSSACDQPPPEDSVEAPCIGDEGTVQDLGRAVGYIGAYAQFSTDGETFWVTAGHFEQGGFFATDRTRIEVGPVSEPPEFDVHTGEEKANISLSVSVKEGYWSPMELDAGDYWIWSSNSANVFVQTCEGGSIFNAVPATLPPDPAS